MIFATKRTDQKSIRKSTKITNISTKQYGTQVAKRKSMFSTKLTINLPTISVALPYIQKHTLRNDRS